MPQLYLQHKNKMSSLYAPKTIAGKSVGPIGYGMMSKLPCKRQRYAIAIAKHYLHSPHAVRRYYTRRGNQAIESRFGKWRHLLERRMNTVGNLPMHRLLKLS